MRDALSEIVLEISTDKSVKEINKLNDNQLEHFITGVMVLMEKTSDVRYIADLRISVDEQILKAYMAENNMPIPYEWLFFDRFDGFFGFCISEHYRSMETAITISQVY